MQPPSRNDLDLHPVRCPGVIEFEDEATILCSKMLDRREIVADPPVHEYKCDHCGCLYLYRLNERGQVVVLSMQRGKPRRRPLTRQGEGAAQVTREGRRAPEYPS